MKKKLQKVIGVLSIMKDFNMKPNFSELERMYGIDRHTIKKYYENGGIPERKKFKRISKWDPLFDVIISLADVHGSYLMSIFQVLNYEYNGNLPDNYNSFKAYAYRRGINVPLQIKLRMSIMRLNQVNSFNVIGYAKILITNLMQSKKL